MSVSSTNHTPSRIPDRCPTHKNQRQRILERLIAARGGEVPSSELAEVSLQYNARVSELREAGFVIISRVEVRDGVKHGRTIDASGRNLARTNCCHVSCCRNRSRHARP
jgi:hypothetical protein